MKKIPFMAALFLIFLIGIGYSAEDLIDRLIAEGRLEGAIPARVVSLDEQNRKSVHGGTLIEAGVAVPYNIKREQVKPTILNAIRSLRNQYPYCRWFVVWLYPDGKNALGSGVHAGRGEYTDEEIEISYGIPTEKFMAEDMEMKKKLADPALTVPRKDEPPSEYDPYDLSVFEDDEDEDYDPDALIYDPDYVPAAPLNKKDFDLGIKIKKLFYKYNKIISDRDLKVVNKNKNFDRDLYWKLAKSLDDRIFKEISLDLQMTEPDVKKLYERISKYYFSGDTERIKR